MSTGSFSNLLRRGFEHGVPQTPGSNIEFPNPGSNSLEGGGDQNPGFQHGVSLLYIWFFKLRYVTVWFLSVSLIAQVLLPRSGRNPLQNAALQPQSWLLEGLKVREKSMQNLLGHSAAWRGRGLGGSTSAEPVGSA